MDTLTMNVYQGHKHNIESTVNTVVDQRPKKKIKSNSINTTSSQVVRGEEKSSIVTQDIENTKYNAEYLYGWQKDWKEIISKSVIYIDASTDAGQFNASILMGRDKERSDLKLHCFNFHAKVVDFFNADEVTIVMTRRSFNKNKEYAPDDIFFNHKNMRIWSFAKAFKFFTRLTTKINLSPEALERVSKHSAHFSCSSLKKNEFKRFGIEKTEAKVDCVILDRQEKIVKKEEQEKKEVKRDFRVPLKEKEVENNKEKDADYNKENEEPLKLKHEKLSTISNPIDRKLNKENEQQRKDKPKSLKTKEPNRLSLIESLRKTVPPVAHSAQPQKLNYQQEVFKRIHNQKAQQTTQSKVFKTSSVNKLGSRSSASSYKLNDKLAALLTKEKLFGPIDRDLSIKSNDFKHFDGPYLLVYDIKQQYRPIFAKEWPKKSSENSIKSPWPRIYPSINGHCVFLPDRIDLSEEAVLKRQKQFASNEKLRNKLQEMFKLITQSQYYSMYEVNIERYNKLGSKEYKQLPSREDLEATNGLSVIDKNSMNIMNSKKRSFMEMQASGITPSYSQSQIFTTSTVKTGPGVTRSHVSSKEFRSLKKRTFDKRIIEETENEAKPVNNSIYISNNNPNNTNHGTTILQHQTQTPKKPQTRKRKDAKDEKFEGYCENCRIRYENFQTHITETRHREFATNAKNFVKIDKFIELIQQDDSNESINIKG